MEDRGPFRPCPFQGVSLESVICPNFLSHSNEGFRPTYSGMDFVVCGRTASVSVSLFSVIGGSLRTLLPAHFYPLSGIGPVTIAGVLYPPPPLFNDQRPPPTPVRRSLFGYDAGSIIMCGRVQYKEGIQGGGGGTGLGSGLEGGRRRGAKTGLNRSGGGAKMAE